MGDAHLRGMDFQRASLELKAFDVEMPVIATPREIVARFFSDSISLRLHLPPASIAARGGAAPALARADDPSPGMACRS